METALQLLDELENKVSSAKSNQCNDDDEKKEIIYDNQDGFDNYLLRTMYSAKKSSDSMVLSSFSILTAMTICMLGSANNTLKQMLNVLYPNIANKQLTFKNSTKITADIIELGKYYNTKYNGNNNNAIIKVANKIWINQGYKILDKYIKASQVDSVGTFNQKAANDAAKIINKWCAENTNNMIKELVDSNIMSRAELVIANAIYFNGKFVNPFDKKKTAKNIPFYASKNRKKEISKVEMMQSEAMQFHAQRINDVYDVVKLQYKMGDAKDNKLSLILVINNRSDDDKIPLFTTKDLLSIDANKKWHRRKIKLFVPKFRFEYQVTLNEVLQKMGIRDAFDGQRADFSNMTGNRALKIDTVIHKAVIDVDEEGTEAAAVTGITMTRMAFRPTPEARFDHPFQFFIFDEEKKVALFSGIFMGK